jgi:hypothetical protein
VREKPISAAPSRAESTSDQGRADAPGYAVVLYCSRGQVEVRAGDEFSARDWHAGGTTRWRIEGFTGDRIYSPSGLGGAPIVRCRPLDGMPASWAEHDNGDGTVDWCGDSVGAAILSPPVAGSEVLEKEKLDEQ